MNLNDCNAFSVSVLRGGRGLIARDPAAIEHPAKPLELYEFEGCPYCKKVRDVLTELDLEYISRACPRGSANRAKVMALGGQCQFPFLVDPNSGRSLYESEAIIDYLYATFRSPRPTIARLFAPLNTLSAAVASAVRPKGIRARPSVSEREQPTELLVLYNFEASPYCKKVRERIHELNLDCHIKNVGKGSARRPELVELGGKMLVPYLVDPNTDVAMYESDDILAYLEREYGV